MEERDHAVQQQQQDKEEREQQQQSNEVEEVEELEQCNKVWERDQVLQQQQGQKETTDEVQAVQILKMTRTNDDIPEYWTEKKAKGKTAIYPLLVCQGKAHAT